MPQLGYQTEIDNTRGLFGTPSADGGLRRLTMAFAAMVILAGVVVGVPVLTGSSEVSAAVSCIQDSSYQTHIAPVGSRDVSVWQGEKVALVIENDRCGDRDNEAMSKIVGWLDDLYQWNARITGTNPRLTAPYEGKIRVEVYSTVGGGLAHHGTLGFAVGPGFFEGLYDRTLDGKNTLDQVFYYESQRNYWTSELQDPIDYHTADGPDQWGWYTVAFNNFLACVIPQEMGVELHYFGSSFQGFCIDNMLGNHETYVSDAQWTWDNSWDRNLLPFKARTSVNDLMTGTLVHLYQQSYGGTDFVTRLYAEIKKRPKLSSKSDTQGSRDNFYVAASLAAGQELSAYFTDTLKWSVSPAAITEVRGKLGTTPPTTAPPATSVPTTSGPTTAPPATAAPTTSGPTTAPPVTAAPTTEAPAETTTTTASPPTTTATTVPLGTGGKPVVEFLTVVDGDTIPQHLKYGELRVGAYDPDAGTEDGDGIRWVVLTINDAESGRFLGARREYYSTYDWGLRLQPGKSYILSVYAVAKRSAGGDWSKASITVTTDSTGSTTSTTAGVTTTTEAATTTTKAATTSTTAAATTTTTTAGVATTTAAVTTTTEAATTTTKAATTSTTAAATTTTTAAATTTTTVSVPPGSSTFHGQKGFRSFGDGVIQQDAWTLGDIAYYAPTGKVDNATADKWLDWYVRVDQLYRKMSARPDFDSVFRANDPNFGRKKVLAVIDSDSNTCGTINAAGCGSKQQAQAGRGYIDQMLADRNDYEDHWIFFYEMGRGGSPERFVGRGVWPANTLIFPHLMAGIAFHELGGDAGIERGIPGHLLDGLADWEQKDEEFVDTFATKLSHDVLAAILYRILQDTDVDTIAQILRNLEQKPQAINAVKAMCDWQSAVNDATGGRYSARMQGEWGMPHNC